MTSAAAIPTLKRIGLLHHGRHPERRIRSRLHLRHSQEAWGHVVAELLRELPGSLEVPDDLIERARVLDNFYIPSRYPNSHSKGAPFQHYGPIQSEQALGYAHAVIDFIRSSA